MDGRKKRNEDKAGIPLTNFVSFKSTVLVLIIFFAFACSQYKMATLLRSNNLRTYDGPVLAKNEVGYLTCATEARALEIAEIDGRAVKEIKDAGGHSGDYDFIELLPGAHTIKVVGSTNHSKALPTSGVTWWTVSLEGKIVLEFTVEPGHIYLVDIEIGEKKEINTDKYKDSNRTISIFIRDRKSKKIVSEEVENKK